MPKIISVNKPFGWTPLQTLKEIKCIYPKLSNIKMSYAGRLDPLAQGVLLLLVGDETKNREKYLSLSKEYKFELVLGLQTDTYDLLGYVKNKIIKSSTNVKLLVNTFVNNHIGKQKIFYPPYSSKTVNGKPLFWWAKNNKLTEIAIPQREIEIFNFRCISIETMNLQELQTRVGNAISSVEGDFRQKEINKRWQQIFSEKTNHNKLMTTAKFSIDCSSGTYIREIVNQLGKDLGCGAVTLDILRTKVGNYSLKDALKLS